MIGGLKRTSSRLAIAAAAGMFVGGAAMTPAQAADLGGDCCADLEERVAELEATTVRHARRQMRLVMSGQVNSALLFWDNGEESDIYVIDSDESSTRLNLRFTGTAVPGITVGGQIEVDFETAVGGQVAENDLDDGTSSDLNVRRAEWFVSGDFGTATVGQGSMAADGAFEVSFSGSALGSVGYGLATTNIGGFAIFNQRTGNYVGDTNRDGDCTDAAVAAGPGPDGIFGNADDTAAIAADACTSTFGISSDFDQGRSNRVRYDTPALAGFVLSAAWGEDDEADVAVRYSNEFNGVRVAAALAYVWEDDGGNGDRQYDEDYGGSIAIQHVPSGVHLQGGYAVRDRQNDDDPASGVQPVKTSQKANNWWIAAGSSFRASSLGTSDITLQYIKTTGAGVYTGADTISTAATAIGDDVEATVYGIGFSQNIDSLGGASIYLSYNHLEVEASNLNDATGNTDLDAEFDYVTAGMRVRF